MNYLADLSKSQLRIQTASLGRRLEVHRQLELLRQIQTPLRQESSRSAPLVLRLDGNNMAVCKGESVLYTISLK